MRQSLLSLWSIALVVISLPLLAQEANHAEEARCKAVYADVVEDGVTSGCKPEHPDCFLGEVDGNHGLRGTTYFRADAVATGPGTSPGFVSYSGEFEYRTDRGTLVARETGVVDPTPGRPAPVRSPPISRSRQAPESSAARPGICS